eukprot:5759716-Amphidinium_carterae.1
MAPSHCDPTYLELCIGPQAVAAAHKAAFRIIRRRHATTCAVVCYLRGLRLSCNACYLPTGRT